MSKPLVSTVRVLILEGGHYHRKKGAKYAAFDNQILFNNLLWPTLVLTLNNIGLRKAVGQLSFKTEIAEQKKKLNPRHLQPVPILFYWISCIYTNKKLSNCVWKAKVKELENFFRKSIASYPVGEKFGIFPLQKLTKTSTGFCKTFSPFYKQP